MLSNCICIEYCYLGININASHIEYIRSSQRTICLPFETTVLDPKMPMSYTQKRTVKYIHDIKARY